MDISFFAERNFLSSDIRGRQIASYLGGKYRPKERFGICVFLKPRSLSKVRDGDWVDVLDAPWLIEALKERPKIKVIAHSLTLYNHLKEVLNNEMVLIHQQHLNWENQRRDRTEVTTGGYIGRSSPEAKVLYAEIGEELKKIGFNFIAYFDYITRQDAVNFYKSIDFLVTTWKEPDPGIYKTATKLINAASFGIPSLAYPYMGYTEFEGYYAPIRNVEDLVREVQKLKDRDYYDNWTKKIIEVADNYHIDKVVERYKQLA